MKTELPRNMNSFDITMKLVVSIPVFAVILGNKPHLIDDFENIHNGHYVSE